MSILSDIFNFFWRLFGGRAKPAPTPAPLPSVPPGTSVSLDPQDWFIQHSINMPSHPTAHTVGWYFDFPTIGEIDYLVTNLNGSIAHASKIVANIEIDAAPGTVFDFKTEPTNTTGHPSAVRLFLQRRGDTLSGQGPYEFYRWWSIPGHVVLADGSFTITANLNPADWSSVFGKKGTDSPSGFSSALSDVANIGFTFGGGSFYGHGVKLESGSARFYLKSFSIQ